LWLNEHLDFKFTVNELAKSASRAFGVLCSKYFNSGGFTYAIFTKLYESLVQPILFYGTAIWGLYEHKKINTVQNKACKFFLGLRRNASNLAARGDMGWQSCVTKQRLDVFRLLRRLKGLGNTRLPHIIHCWSSRKGRSWEKDVLKVAKSVNILKYVDVPTISAAQLVLIKKHLFQMDETAWFSELWNDNNNGNGNKLRTYRLCKKDLAPEQYVLSKFINRNARKSLARLRSGSLPLNIETLRYSRPPVPLNDRICPFCCDCVESEVHFLIDCNVYNDLRYDVLNYMNVHVTNFRNLTSTDKFMNVINCVDNCQVLCNMVDKMFQRRLALL